MKIVLSIVSIGLAFGLSGDFARASLGPDCILYPSGRALLEKLHALPGYKLSVKTDGKDASIDLHVPFPVYRFDAGDVNNDGNIDILLGVIKPTHFDPENRRRLFIFQIDRERLAPLWLGSRVCLELMDFHCIRQGTITMILTIERDKRGTFCNGLYRWQDFGLELVRYSNNEASYDTAQKYFDRESDHAWM